MKSDWLRQVGLQVTDTFLDILMVKVRELIIIGGWRAGKSTLLAAILFCFIMTRVLMKRPALVWLVGPTYKLTHAEYGFLLSWLSMAGQVEGKPGMAEEGPRVMHLRGGITVETKSADDPVSLAMVAPDIIGVCEAGQVPDEARLMLVGRTAEKHAPLIESGTLENKEGKPQYAWYQELAALWLEGGTCDKFHDCQTEHASYSLPSWTNRVVYPGGENDPEILRLKQEYDPHTFLRYVAGVPTGVQFAVYPSAVEKEAHLLRRMTQQDTLAPVLFGAGGIDYGGVGMEVTQNPQEQHLTTLCVGQVIEDVRDKQMAGPKGIVWVREVKWLDYRPQDTAQLKAAHRELAQRWRAWRWKTDPNERFMARSFQADAISYSTSARMARVGLVEARLNLNKVYFDIEGPGVKRFYEQLKRVHKRKQRDGMLIYDRRDDDGVASFEDMIEAVDGGPLIPAQQPMAIKRYRPQPRKVYRSA